MVAEDFLVEQFVKPLISSEESGCPAIDLSGNYVTANTVFKLGPP